MFSYHCGSQFSLKIFFILIHVIKICKIIIICIIKSFFSTQYYFICLPRSQIGFLFPCTFKFSSVRPRNTVWSPYWESPSCWDLLLPSTPVLGHLGLPPPLWLQERSSSCLSALFCAEEQTDTFVSHQCFVSRLEWVSQRALLPQKWVNEDVSIIEDNNIMSFDKRMPFLKEAWNQQEQNSAGGTGFQNAEGYKIKVW